MVIGAVEYGWLKLTYYLNISYIVFTLIALVIPIIVTGGFHVDGYMDCCDAIFSRRDLAERQRILKDSAVGAFAAIGLAVLLLIQAAAMYEITVRPEFFPALALAPMLSRMMSAEAVWNNRPLATSQYNRQAENPKSRKPLEVAMVLLAVAVIVAFYFFFDIDGFFTVLSDFDTILAVALVVHFIACYGARKNLGGMSGDISGFAITLSEAAAIITAAIL